MKRLLSTIIWDLKLALKYQIVTVAIGISVIYMLIFRIVPGINYTPLLITLIFTEPTSLGYIFIGAMILFEKAANTLQAVVVTPLKPWQYLWSKALSLTLISVVCSFVMAFAGHGFEFRYVYLLLAVLLSSVLFIFIGFIGVARVKSFNQYIIVVPLFLAPAMLPLINLFGITNSYLLYLIPTQGSLLLFDAAFNQVLPWKILYSLVYLTLAVLVSYKIAERSFLKHIVGE
jgi:fluoroquinolone transport system permease protein